MSKIIDDGGQAFTSGPQSGLSKREYFAAAALTGYLAAFCGEGIQFPIPSDAAEYAFDVADAMMWELKP